MKSLAVVLSLTAILITVSADVQTEKTDAQTEKSNDVLNDRNGQTDKPMILRSIDDKKEFPRETQMAQCTVQSADGLKVQAQATFSKKLDGICSTDDMKKLKENLIAMENRLYRDIYELQLLMRRLLPQSQNSYDNYYRYDGYDQQQNYNQNSGNYQQDVYYQPASPHQESYYQQQQEDRYYQNRATPQQPQPSYSKPKEQDTPQQQNQIKPTEKIPSTAAVPFKPTTSNPLITLATTQTPRRAPEVINSNMLKSLNTIRSKQNKILATSTTTEAPAKIVPTNEYSYYWKLDNFPKTFQNAKKNEIFSHVFNVKGLFIRMYAMLNMREDEKLLLDIEHLAENTEKMEVEMSDGLVFQEIAEEKLFQYSFEILDQNNPHHIHMSPTFWNNDNENYLIPNSIHSLKNFLKDNSLLIKLVIKF